MKALSIARINLLRMLADRSNIFFVFILPLALVLLIGAQFGAPLQPRLGLTAAALPAEVLAGFEEQGVELERYQSRAAMLDDVSRGELDAGFELPADAEDRLRQGAEVPMSFVARPQGAGPQLRTVVEQVMQDWAAPFVAAAELSSGADLPYEQALAAAQASVVPGVQVRTVTVGERLFPASLGQFDLGASNQLVLFMFLTTLAGSAALIQSRQLGVSRRMLSTPTPARTIVAGEVLGRFAVAVFQGLYIMLATLVVFRVDWGSAPGALALVALFGLVGAGAATLMGATFRNDQQAGGIGVVAGLVLAALGGAMAPIELFSPTMRAVARLTPHAWALDGFAELVREDATLAGILPQLGVLAGFAAGLILLASWKLRRALTQ